MLKVHFINVGDGDTTLLEFSDGKTMLIDADLHEPEENFVDYLKKVLTIKCDEETGEEYQELNYVVITHPHDDHMSGLRAIIDSFRVGEVWESGHRFKSDSKYYPDYKKIMEDLKQEGKLCVPTAKRKVYRELSDRTIVHCFAPSKSVVTDDTVSETDIHNQCIVLRIEYGKFSILFAGDSEHESWSDRIVPNYSDKVEDGQREPNLLKADILHVSHHGSITFFADTEDSEDLYVRGLEKIAPDLAVVSVGPNKHGHPHKKALDLYKNHPTKRLVLRTDKEGTIVLRAKSDGSWIIKDKNGKKLVDSKDANLVRTIETVGVVGVTANGGIVSKSSVQAVRTTEEHRWYGDSEGES